MSSITNSDSIDLSFVADFHKKMVEKDSLLIFKGTFNQNITKAVLKMAESKMDAVDEKKITRKRVFNIMVECLQNISKHADEFDEDDNEDAIFLLGRSQDGYNVSTGNIIEIENKKILSELLQGVNSMDETSLKQVYQRIRKNNMLTGKGGAGLGLIDMARKAKSKLMFEFVDIEDPEFEFFTMNTFVRKSS